MKKITLLLAYILFITLQPAMAEKRNVLFLGNSYTYFNNLPQMIADLANSLGDTLTFDSHTPGGYTAFQHSADITSISKIAQGNWDYVSIQCQSQEPAFSPAQVNSQTLPYIISLDSTIQATNSCAETLYFMTWGRKNGDASNCSNYPPICTYDGMQQRLRESYLLFADSTAASLSPVGAAWKKMRDTYPNVELYNPDESHPSINGSYLAACVFYCTLFQKSCVGSQYLPGGVGNADAFYMQQIADNIVLDSIENWQSKGHIPFADFSFSASPNPSLFSFTNSSKRFTSSLWHFNDGSNTDTTTNPFHLFPNTTSTYNVCLEVKSACGKKDSVFKTIMVNGTGTANVQAGSDIIITQHARYIYLHHLNKNVTAQLFDLNGRCIMSEELLSPSATMDLSKYLPGVYVLCLADDYLRIVTKKIVIY